MMTSMIYQIARLFILLLIASPVWAQTFLPEPTRKYSTLKSDKSSQESNEQVVRFETELTTSIELPGIVLESCPARVSLSYYQKNTLAHVVGKIEFAECVSSEGSFNVIASIRDDDGNRTSLRFQETWQASDQMPVSFERDYPIGESVTLMQVRSSRAKCACLEQPGE